MGAAPEAAFYEIAPKRYSWIALALSFSMSFKKPEGALSILLVALVHIIKLTCHASWRSYHSSIIWASSLWRNSFALFTILVVDAFWQDLGIARLEGGIG